MPRSVAVALFLVAFAAVLIACGSPADNTGEPTSAAIAQPTATGVLATVPPAPTDLPSPTETPLPTATPLPTDTPAPTATPLQTDTPAPTDMPATTDMPTVPPSTVPPATPPAVAAGICPDLPRPALLTGPPYYASYMLYDPVSGQECGTGLRVRAEPESVSVVGDHLYFVMSEDDTHKVVARLRPDLSIEPLSFTQIEAAFPPLVEFYTVAADGRIAWSSSQEQGGEQESAYLQYLWVAAPDGSDQVEIMREESQGVLYFIKPIRFSADGETLFFTRQPDGLGGSWMSYRGQFHNLFRVPATGGEVELLFDCDDVNAFMCISDFRDDGTFAYTDAEDFIHVVEPSGVELARIPPSGNYVGHAVFNQNGDLFFSVAEVSDDLFPTMGMIYTVPAPYTAAPTLVAAAEGLLIMTSFRFDGFLDAEHMMVNYGPRRGPNLSDWGEAILDTTTGEIMPLATTPYWGFMDVWPAAETE